MNLARCFHRIRYILKLQNHGQPVKVHDHTEHENPIDKLQNKQINAIVSEAREASNTQ